MVVVVHRALSLYNCSVIPSKAESETKIGVPFPSPGSNAPKKYSAFVIFIFLETKLLELTKQTFLNNGPQLLFASFNRIFTKKGFVEKPIIV